MTTTCCCCCCCCCCGNHKVRWQLLSWWWTLVVDEADEEWHRKNNNNTIVWKPTKSHVIRLQMNLCKKKVPPWLAWQATTASSLLLTTTVNTSNIKIGPRDINNFSWVIGMFFYFTNNIFRYYYNNNRMIEWQGVRKQQDGSGMAGSVKRIQGVRRDGKQY